MTWSEARAVARAGTPVRRAGWLDRWIRWDRYLWWVRPVNPVTGADTGSLRVVQSTDWSPSEFLAADWTTDPPERGAPEDVVAVGIDVRFPNEPVASGAVPLDTFLIVTAGAVRLANGSLQTALSSTAGWWATGAAHVAWTVEVAPGTVERIAFWDDDVMIKIGGVIVHNPRQNPSDYQCPYRPAWMPIANAWSWLPHPPVSIDQEMQIGTAVEIWSFNGWQSWRTSPWACTVRYSDGAERTITGGAWALGPADTAEHQAAGWPGGTCHVPPLPPKFEEYRIAGSLEIPPPED
jgi:hypothetical protein